MIIKVEAIVREEKAEDVIAALDHIQVNGVTVTKVEGYGAQRGADNWVKGMKQKAAYTGDYGDGKIFTYEVRSAQKIRTGETGYDAIQQQE